MKKGLIIEQYPNLIYDVELETGDVIKAYVSGRMKFNKIKLCIGDSVEVLIDTYGKTHKIVTRLKK